MTTTTERPSTAVLLEHLPVAKLRAHPLNVRTDLGELGELTDSVRAQGVLQPLIVFPFGETGLYRVVAGHRRLEAARQAKLATVPCLLRPDLADEGAAVEAMLVENGRRRDLTVLEEADGVQTLLDFPGYDVARVARAIGHNQRTVRERKRIAAAPPRVRHQLAAGEISLEQALQVQSFADDPVIFERLLNDLGSTNFRFSLQHEFEQRTRKQRTAAAEKELDDAGVRVVGSAILQQHDCETLADVRRLDPLTRETGEVRHELGDVGHASCPGHAAFVTSYPELLHTYVCTTAGAHTFETDETVTAEPQGEPNAAAAPKAGPEPTRDATAPVSPPIDESATRVREAQAEKDRLNRDLQTASVVRAQHLAEVIRTGEPALSLRLLRRAAVARLPMHDRAPELLGLEPSTGVDLDDLAAVVNGLQLEQLAVLLFLLGPNVALGERDLSNASWWNNPDGMWWQTELEDHLGYVWSDVELSLLDPAGWEKR